MVTYPCQILTENNTIRNQKTISAVIYTDFLFFLKGQSHKKLAR
jgi:hypothetical protein